MIRINFSELKFPDPRARECILRGGSKGGFYDFFSDNWKGTKFEKHLPEGRHFFCDTTVQKDPREYIGIVEKSDRPKFLRSCILPNEEFNYAGDFAGAVDLLPSEAIEDPDSLREKINLLKLLVQSKSIKDYIKWDGGDPENIRLAFEIEDFYTGTKSRRVGSIVEHPHDKGTYVAEVCESSVPKGDIGSINTVIADEHGDSKETGVYPAGITLQNFEEIVDCYKDIKDSGFIPEGYTFQMEFVIYGYKKFKVVQARLFRKEEERANFDFSETNYKTKTPTYSSFGITPKDGVEVDIDHINNFYGAGSSSAFYNFFRNHDSLPLVITPKEISFFASSTVSGAFLNHGPYRFLIKSDYFMGLNENSELFVDSTLPGKARFISNGINSWLVAE